VLVFVGPDGAVEREVPDLAAVCAQVRAVLDRPATPNGRPPIG
jgi:hypothetical protein